MKQFLNNIYEVESDFLEEYVSHWENYNLPKKTIMTQAGSVERYIYFVLEGVQKSYYLNDGNQHIMAFTYAPSFSGVAESFLTQTPSAYFLETITDSNFLRLSYAEHQRLINKHRPLETLFRKATENILLGFVHRHHELMAHNIETRFRAFAKRSPHLFNLLSRKDIASYLRIDPTNLSKLISTIRI